ncbi:MAG: TraM recognition domain-containing protein, partial [Candidatus Doudnabacteria bacterium]
RQMQSGQERKPFYLYIDEFQNFITPSMKAILSGARKYHLGLILAHQDLHQLWETDTGLANAIISNAGTRVCFRIGDFDAQKLQSGFSHFDTSDLQNLSIGEAVVRVERSDNDFNLKTYLPAAIDVQKAMNNKERITELSRNKYGHIAADVKREIKEESPILKLPRPNKVVSKNEIAVVPQSELLKINVEDTEQKNITYHRYLQTLIKRMAEQRGFKAVIEEPTSDKQGRVDVGLERNDEKIACEVTVTTKDDHELRNIEKCFRSGFQKVLLCVPDKTRVESLQKLIAKQFDQEYASRIFLVHPDELFLFFERENPKGTEHNTETIVKGYRVKIEYNKISDTEKKQKREAIGGVIAQSLKRLKSETK